MNLTALLFCLLACCLIMVFVWLWTKKILNAGVVDVFWHYNGKYPISLLIILYSLLKVAGIPTTKEQSLRSKRDT
jgi:steroid 5-alpha reductase family enzyme